MTTGEMPFVSIPDHKLSLWQQRPLILRAICIWAEARGEPYEGKVAVGYVIGNRMKDHRWPDTVAEVVLQPKQFSGVWSHRYSARLLDPVLVDDEPDTWADCLQAAMDSSCGRLDDPTLGATHFHTTSTRPWWCLAETMKWRATIGNHHFYTELEEVIL